MAISFTDRLHPYKSKLRGLFSGRLYHAWRSLVDHSAMVEALSVDPTRPQLQHPSSVAILFIGTHLYVNFFPRYYRTIKELFLPGTPKTFYVFTDRIEADFLAGKPDVVVLRTEHKPFPYVPMLKFKILNQAAEQLASHSHVVYVDADMYATSPTLEAELFAHDMPLFGVRHYNFVRLEGAGELEHDPASMAAVQPSDDVSTYWQGCFWGGTSEAVLEACRELEARVDRDIERGIVARWWDESFLNKYFIDHKPRVHTCPPSYAWPVHKPLPRAFAAKFLHVIENPEDAKDIPPIKATVRASWRR